MSVILISEIDAMIYKLQTAGVNVYKDGYAIYAAPESYFVGGVYPLEVITSDQLPKGVVCIIAKKEETK